MPKKKKFQANISDEHKYKNLQQNTVNQIHHNQVELFLGCKNGATSVSQSLWYISLMK